VLSRVDKPKPNKTNKFLVLSGKIHPCNP